MCCRWMSPGPVWRPHTGALPLSCTYPPSFPPQTQVSEAGCDLLNQCLRYDPKQRSSAEQALGSKWFTEKPPPFTPEEVRDLLLMRIVVIDRCGLLWVVGLLWIVVVDCRGLSWIATTDVKPHPPT